MSRRVVRLIVLSLTILTACQSIDSSSRLELPLLPPASWSSEVQATQVVTAGAGHDQRRVTVTTALRLTPDLITMVGLSAVGQRLITIEYDGEILEVQKDPTAEGLPAREMLGLLQLALFPEQALRVAYIHPWKLVVKNNSRQAFFDGELVIEVMLSDWQSGWPNIIKIDNHISEMVIDITTVELQVL